MFLLSALLLPSFSFDIEMKTQALKSSPYDSHVVTPNCITESAHPLVSLWLSWLSHLTGVSEWLLICWHFHISRSWPGWYNMVCFLLYGCRCGLTNITMKPGKQSKTKQTKVSALQYLLIWCHVDTLFNLSAHKPWMVAHTVGVLTWSVHWDGNINLLEKMINLLERCVWVHLCKKKSGSV